MSDSKPHFNIIVTNKQIGEFTISCVDLWKVSPLHFEIRSEPRVLLWFAVDPKRKYGVNLSSDHVSIPRRTGRRYNRLAYSGRYGNGGANRHVANTRAARPAGSGRCRASPGRADGRSIACALPRKQETRLDRRGFAGANSGRRSSLCAYINNDMNLRLKYTIIIMTTTSNPPVHRWRNKTVFHSPRVMNVEFSLSQGSLRSFSKNRWSS